MLFINNVNIDEGGTYIIKKMGKYLIMIMIYNEIL